MSDLVAKDVFDQLPEMYRRRAREISARVRDIDASLARCKPEDIQDALVRLAGQLQFQPGVDPSDTAVEYKAACRNLPAWAVSEAAADFNGGRVDGHTGKYMPTSAEFAIRARSIVTPLLAEHSALRIEASKLLERAEDDRRRHIIDMERQDPRVRDRVASLTEAVTAGAPKRISGAGHVGLSPESQARLDAFKKPRPDVSKIGHVRNTGAAE